MALYWIGSLLMVAAMVYAFVPGGAEKMARSNQGFRGPFRPKSVAGMRRLSLAVGALGLAIIALLIAGVDLT